MIEFARSVDCVPPRTAFGRGCDFLRKFVFTEVALKVRSILFFFLLFRSFHLNLATLVLLLHLALGLLKLGLFQLLLYFEVSLKKRIVVIKLRMDAIRAAHWFPLNGEITFQPKAIGPGFD